MKTVKEMYLAFSNNNAGQLFVEVRKQSEKQMPKASKLYKTTETTEFRKIDEKLEKVTVVKEYYYDENDAHVELVKSKIL